LSRARFLYRPDDPAANENGMVPAHLAVSREIQSTTYIISDTMDHIKHPVTGAMIDSKAEFRAHTRISGCVEVGTDRQASIPKPRHAPNEIDIVNDVRRSIAELNR